MLTWATCHIFIAPLIIRWGFRKVALMGCVAILVGFSGLVAGAFLGWSGWALTAILAVTGFGFGSSSMAYLLGAQDAVDYHQRGIVTSTVSFCRTIGGAMGVGLLGAGFNLLSRERLDELSSKGVSPAAALDPHTQASLSPDVIEIIRTTIAGGLKWVFVAMLVVAGAQLIATWMMQRRVPGGEVKASDAVEA
jgi:hypothetical protein